jgi:hypothetical protein
VNIQEIFDGLDVQQADCKYLLVDRDVDGRIIPKEVADKIWLAALKIMYYQERTTTVLDGSIGLCHTRLHICMRSQYNYE